MKWLDKQGQLFGRFNLIDAITLLLTISFVSYFGLDWVHKRIYQLDQPLTAAIDIHMVLQDISSEQTKKLKPGLPLYDLKFREVGNIVEVGDPKPIIYEVTFSPEVLVQATSLKQFFQVPVKVHLKGHVFHGTTYGQQFYFQDQPLSEGARLVLRTRDLSFPAVVRMLEKTPYWIMVKIKGWDVPNEVVRLMKVGDMQFDVVGRPTMEVSAIEKKEEIDTEQQLMARHANVLVWMKMQQLTNDPARNIRIGESVIFRSANYLLNGMVVEVRSLPEGQQHVGIA